MKKMILFFAMFVTLFACDDIDNYHEAVGVIDGGIYDKKTLELIPAQSPNGARIYLYEEGYIQPIKFWCSNDGSFYNQRVFSGNYKIIPEGPFITSSSDTIRMAIPTEEKVCFYVEPFLRIKASGTIDVNSAIVTFRINKSDEWNGVLDEYVILYSTTKGIDINNYKFKKAFSVPSNDVNSILNQDISFIIDEIDKSKPIFVRVAAKTTNTTYYNYSDVIYLK